MFGAELPVKINIGKRIGHIYNMTSRTFPIHLQTIISSYHHILIILYKLNSMVLMMILWMKKM